MLKPLEYVYIDVVIGYIEILINEIENIQTPILHFTMQLIIKITQSGFRLWFWPVDTWSIHVWQNWGNSREVLFTARARRCENSAQLTQLTACQRSPVYSAALSAVLTFLLAAIQPTTPVFQARLLSTWRTPTLSCATSGARNKVFRRACSQVHPSQPSDWSCQGSLRPRSCSQASSFRYSNRLKLTSPRAFRNLVYEFACVKCEESRACKPNYGNSLVVFTTLKNQTSLILTTSLATAKYTTGICLLRALIRASTLSKKIIHAVAATS